MKRVALQHPKVEEFREELEAANCPASVSRASALGLLEGLFGYTAHHSPSGRLGKIRPRRIAEFLGYTLTSPEELLEMLKRAGWIDDLEDGPAIHGWSEHVDRYVHKSVARRKETFADGTFPNLNYLDRDQRPEARAFYENLRQSAAGEPVGMPTGSIAEPEQEQEKEPSQSPPEAVLKGFTSAQRSEFREWLAKTAAPLWDEEIKSKAIERHVFERAQVKAKNGALNPDWDPVLACKHFARKRCEARHKANLRGGRG